MKRYAIVRVDDSCPFMQEKFDFGSCIKMFNCAKFIRCEKCEHNCRYGDTKEQMVSKVEQIIRRPIQRGDLELKSKGFKYGVRRLAKEIVEFLGVE